MFKRLLMVLGSALPIWAQAEDFAAPPGWRVPNIKDYSHDWAEIKSRLPTPYKLAGDFNGDKIQDQIWILFKAGQKHSDKDWGLFARISRPDGNYDVQKLESYKNWVEAQTMALESAEPGVYKTACGEGYWKCAKGEPKSVKLQGEGFFLVAIDKASTLYYWDAKRKKFNKVAESD